MASSLISGIGQRVKDAFSGAATMIRDKTGKPKEVLTEYPKSGTIQERIKWLLDRYYYETQYEKLQFHRKWFRNHLIFCGYHDLNLISDVDWTAILQNAPEYAFPSNYYRSYVKYGAALYVQTAPEFISQPSSDDPESQAVAEAARGALEIVKENVGYDAMRAREAINLRVYGNSFRYSYYATDPRYGFVTVPVYEDVKTEIAAGGWYCPVCGMSGDGENHVCPNCGPQENPDMQPLNIPPQKAQVPTPMGKTKFSRGQETSEVVWPFETYVRSSVKDLWNAPFILRARMVDKVGLQATFSKAEFGAGHMVGDSVQASEDIGLMYQQAIPDLPSDPTQYAAWYERAVAPSKVPFIQGWLRPEMYFFDRELKEKFDDGLEAGKANDCLLYSRNASMDDHWTHFKHTHVEGRFWGDGDDDLIPEQLKLDELDRLILRHIDYNTLPVLMADTQRVNKNQILNDAGVIVEVKNLGGKPIDQAAKWLPGGQLSSDVWQQRGVILQNMEFHSGVFGSAIGQHQPGVNSFGGQEQMASKAMQTLTPLQLMYKEANETWAMQMLKICSENWLDDRVQATMGLNGQWQFKMLRGEMLKMDRVRVKARIIPLDPAQQQSFNQAIAVGAFNPQLPPVVRRKVLELYQLPEEMDDFTMDSKSQWKEIEQMKQGQQVSVTPIRDNDAVHLKVLHDYMNSDEWDTLPPQAKQIIFQHGLAHMQNQANMMAIQGAMEAHNPQQQQQPQQQQNPNENAGFRHQRGVQGAAAKPNRPQPSGGNQNHVGRPGMSHSAQQRRRNGR